MTDRTRDGDPKRSKTLSKKELEALMIESRAGRLFGTPLTEWTGGASCLDCGVALIWIKWKGAPRYCCDCAAERGVKQHTTPKDA